MSNTLWLDAWLIRTAFAGGAILLLGLIWMLFTRQPARRQRIGELSLCSGLLVALLTALPGWWSCPSDWTPPVPSLAEHQALTVAKPQAAELELDAEELVPMEEEYLAHAEPYWFTNVFWLMMNPYSTEARYAAGRAPELMPRSPSTPAMTIANKEPNAEEQQSALDSPLAPLGSFPWLLLLSWSYFLIMGFLLCRCLAGYIGLWRLVRSAEKAPAHAITLLEKLTPDWKRKPRLGVHERLHGPISFGLWKPTILLPPKFCYAGDQAALRALLVHELTHLERHDAWSCLLLAVSQAVYFYLPWFWWLRQQIHLAQEYIADAAAACLSSAVDYAQYLVSWSTWTSRPTLAGSRANGVFQRTSELYRRVNMLLTNPVKVEPACSRRWTFAAAASFLAVAAVAAGVRVQAQEPAPKKSVTVVVDDCDDCKCEKKSETRHVTTVREVKGEALKVAKDQKIQIIIVGQDGETKLAEVPGNVGTLMLHPSKEDGKPQRVEVILVDEKGQQVKGGQAHALTLDKTGRVVQGGPAKAMAVWQGKKEDGAKIVGPNVIRIYAVTEDGKVTATPHKVNVIGLAGQGQEKHDVRVQLKPVIAAPGKVEKVDVILVDEAGSLYKKEVSGEKLHFTPGTVVGGAPHTIYLRAVDGQEGSKGQLKLQHVQGGQIQLWSGDKDAKGILKMTPGVKVWSDDKDGRGVFQVLPALPQVPAVPGKPSINFTPAQPGTFSFQPGQFHVQPGQGTFNKEGIFQPATRLSTASGYTTLMQGQDGMREQLDKALDELQKALDKGGDRIPAEARKQLIEAKKQLEEVRAKLGRGRVRVQLDAERNKDKEKDAKDKVKEDMKRKIDDEVKRKMGEDMKRKGGEDQDRYSEQLKRARQQAEAARHQAEAERQRAEAMLKLARAREEQARKMADQQEEQAKRAEDEARRAMEEARRAELEARRRAEMDSRRAQQEAERAQAEARRQAEQQVRRAKEQAERAQAEARKRAEMDGRQAQEKDELQRDRDRRRAEMAARQAQEQERAQQEERRARLEAMRERRKELKDTDEGTAKAAPRQSRQLGVQLEPVGSEVISLLDLPEGNYVLIRNVVAGSAAEKAGLKNNDILLTFAGKRIREPEDVVKLVNDPKVDGNLEAVVFRKGKKVVIHNIEMAAPKKQADSAAAPKKADLPATPKPPTAPRPPSSASRAEKAKDGTPSSSNFTIISQEDGTTITIKGRTVEGRMTAESITIKDGDNEDTYDSLRRVPSKLRAKVAKLLEQGGKTAK